MPRASRKAVRHHNARCLSVGAGTAHVAATSCFASGRREVVKARECAPREMPLPSPPRCRPYAVKGDAAA